MTRHKQDGGTPKTRGNATSTRALSHNACMAGLLLLCALCPLVATAAYTPSADGQEVTDSSTGLTWRRCAEGMAWSGSTCTGTATTYTHEQALQRAQSQAKATGKAWRLPNVKELSSITKLDDAVNPSIDTTAFPAAPASWFWSSSPYVGISSSAWGVNFSYGYVYGSYRDSYYHVLLVR